MVLSGHKTSDAARLYGKRTEKQRTIGARRRRDDTWVLGWTLENWGIKAYTYGEPEEEWWTANTEAGRGDVSRLVDLSNHART